MVALAIMTSPRHYLGETQKALEALKGKFGEKAPDLVMVLGSGLGAFADDLKNAKQLAYEKIPGFEKPTVPGHSGEAWVGEIGSRRVLVYRGRFHYYEGHSLAIATIPIRAAALWGIPAMVVTNAAGGMRPDLSPGTLMLIRDHINLIGQNPLRGPNQEEFGPRFVDMTCAYDPGFRTHALSVAAETKLPLPEGVYAAMPGPSYETPAEVKMLQKMGVDAVGMSTVPEVIVARHHGMRVLGISCITNLAAGSGSELSVDHEEVLETTKRVEKSFRQFLQKWIETYDA